MCNFRILQLKFSFFGILQIIKSQRFCKPLHSFKLFAFASLSLFCSRLFMINKQALFAYYSQSGHKDCAKYVAEICQRLLQISASHLVFEKSKWNSRKRNLISNSDCKIGFVRIPRLNLCRCTALLLMSSWDKGYGDQQHCMQLPWSRHVKFYLFYWSNRKWNSKPAFHAENLSLSLWNLSRIFPCVPNFSVQIWMDQKETFLPAARFEASSSFQKASSFCELSWDRRLLLLFFKFEHFSFVLFELNLGLQKHWVSWVKWTNLSKPDASLFLWILAWLCV